MHYYRINFDGTGLTALTEADANHQVVFSPDMKYYVDTYSRVDLPPVMGAAARRRQGDHGSGTRRHHRADESGVEAPESSWRSAATARPTSGGDLPPHEFRSVQKISGHREHLCRVRTPRSCRSRSRHYHAMQAQAEVGFIVVQIDGMGTSNRSKAFHDVAWKNIGDAGFPDRILWHKAVAAKYPYYDITRVGIYGGSAGGQNSLGGLLFHPEFYKVAVSYAGCHDNRMDKIWWNEQWMGWPIGPHYRRRPTWTMPSGFRASSCWSSASWTPTWIRPRRCRSSTS